MSTKAIGNDDTKIIFRNDGTQEISCTAQLVNVPIWLLNSSVGLAFTAYEKIVSTASYYLFANTEGAQEPANKNYYTREDLKLIFGETERLIKKGSYFDGSYTITLKKPDQTTKQIGFWTFSTIFPSKGYSTSYEVVNKDIIYAAIDLKKRYSKVALLNPADAQNPGGGTREGTPALEEDICRRSSLLPELERQTYPLYGRTLLYSENVPFFRWGMDRQYAYMEKPEYLSVITAAALNLNSNIQGAQPKYNDDQQGFITETEKRIYSQLWKAAEEGNEALVLTAFGCGAFKNDPKIVSFIYKKVLEKYFSGVFQNVTFAIIDGSNTNNFKIFKEAFK